MLGTDLVKVLGKKEVVGLDMENMDVTDGDKVFKAIAKIRPALLIHAAAFTDVDGCELNPDRAYKVNSLGTKNLALSCRRNGVAMVYISTDFVFNGEKGSPYHEKDTPAPLNSYGKSKLEGERWVIELLDTFFIVRTSWLYGKEGQNFVKAIISLGREKEELKVVDDQVGSPTYTLDLAKAIERLIESAPPDLYHIANQGSCSRYTFAEKILELAGLDRKVIPISSKELNQPAKRPRNSTLISQHLESTLGYRMRRWEEALKEFFS